jgi:hypothetical protein
MRKLLLFLPIILSGVLLAACGSNQPSIIIETAEFDFGNVENGQIVSRELTVRNEGNADLVIDSVSTSCSCTTASVTPMTIAPGETGILHIEFDSGAHGPDMTGELIRQVFVTTNDPNLPEAKVEVSVFVEPRSS